MTTATAHAPAPARAGRQRPAAPRRPTTTPPPPPRPFPAPGGGGKVLVLLPSGHALDLLAPDPRAWTDEDLALGLARTPRWAGATVWARPLSVAQHSLLVLALRRAQRGAPALARDEARRELLHDAAEGLLGWDPIGPLKPFLGPGFAALDARLQAAVDLRYNLPAWSPAERRRHKRADRRAAADEAVRVAGWPEGAARRRLGLRPGPPGAPCALPPPEPGLAEWEPWPADLAARLFLAELRRLAPPGVVRDAPGAAHGGAP